MEFLQWGNRQRSAESPQPRRELPENSLCEGLIAGSIHEEASHRRPSSPPIDWIPDIDGWISYPSALDAPQVNTYAIESIDVSSNDLPALPVDIGRSESTKDDSISKGNHTGPVCQPGPEIRKSPNSGVSQELNCNYLSSPYPGIPTVEIPAKPDILNTPEQDINVSSHRSAHAENRERISGAEIYDIQGHKRGVC